MMTISEEFLVVVLLLVVGVPLLGWLLSLIDDSGNS
jgi:hypothetical protein